jgi:hypothetical protein
VSFLLRSRYPVRPTHDWTSLARYTAVLKIAAMSPQPRTLHIRFGHVQTAALPSAMSKYVHAGELKIVNDGFNPYDCPSWIAGHLERTRVCTTAHALQSRARNELFFDLSGTRVRTVSGNVAELIMADVETFFRHPFLPADRGRRRHLLRPGSVLAVT